MFLKLDERLERRENQSHYRKGISSETTACSYLKFGSVPNLTLCLAVRIPKNNCSKNCSRVLAVL